LLFSHKRPLLFGEVLFDIFPDGVEVIGGAPFNVAWHLQGFGCRPLIVSRVGDDARGHKVIAQMQKWGMDLTGMQIDKSHPTGTVKVTLDRGQPNFSIEPDQAYDFIEWPAIAAGLKDLSVALLYHGTLVGRSPVSEKTLWRLRQENMPPAFVDLNLRQPWWNAGRVEKYLRQTRWAKLNEDELRQLWPAIEGEIETAQEFCVAKRLEYLVVTKGSEGAFIYTYAGQLLREQPLKAVPLIDTVGAGDAFSSVMIMGLLYDWALEVTLRRAVHFASEICGIQGAISADTELYKIYRNEWELAE